MPEVLHHLLLGHVHSLRVVKGVVYAETSEGIPVPSAVVAISTEEVTEVDERIYIALYIVEVVVIEGRCGETTTTFPS